jgi:sugar phosphate isomerase/epimerase
LADIGYRSVAITIDHHALNPLGNRAALEKQLAEVARLLEQFEMRSAIETGARFLLDPTSKHEPTLMTADAARRQKRIQFLSGAIEIAAELRSDCVSIWSGTLRDEINDAEALRRLVESLKPVIDYASERNVAIGFEPEPGMFVDTMQSYATLVDRVDSPYFKLTLDVGHLHCLGETPIADQIIRWGSHIVNVHIEDMRAGKHEHLMFGEGEMDFRPIIDALAQVGYQGGLHVELSRHSHDGPTAARFAFDFLQRLLG